MKVKAKFSQEYLLAESVQTEFENQRWLEVQRRAALESHSGHAFKSERSRRSASRWLSRRGCYVTVTFPETDLVPDILKARVAFQGRKSVATAARLARRLLAPRVFHAAFKDALLQEGPVSVDAYEAFVTTVDDPTLVLSTTTQALP